MAGWSFTVVRQPVENYSRRLDRNAVLASWIVGTGGIRWIGQLVDRGEAVCVRSDGYPNLYTAPARLIVAALAGAEPPWDETFPLSRPHGISIKRDALAVCPPDEMLTVAAWDQS